jgi:hypothetical protein
MNGLAFGVLVILAGFVAYYATSPLRRRRLELTSATSPAKDSFRQK